MESQWPSCGRTLATRLAALDYEQLPASVVDNVKLFTLDTFGVIAASARAPGMDALMAALTEWESGGCATLLLNGRQVNPVSAALANGAAAHSLDFDDQHDPARVHAFCVILPTVLAAAQAHGHVSGKTALTALAVGVELFCRLGLTCYNSLGKGWHPTTALGCISAAAAAAKVFGLDAEQTLNAMGLAYVQMSGTTQFIADGVLAKRVGPGFAARSGLQAAQLARHGITGPARFLEGKAGLFTLYERGEVSPEILLDGWGERWHLLDLSMKPWPCCRCTHTAIQLALALRAEGIRPEHIESGVIALGQVNHQIVGAPFLQQHPTPTVHAQFNAAYAFAAALTDGQVGIDSFTPQQVRRDATAWASRLRCEVAADFPATAVPPARVRLQMTDGATREITSLTMKGAPDDPLSTEEVLTKFRANLAHGWRTPSARVGVLEKVLLSLEQQDSMTLVMSLFVACQPGGQSS
ncbi:MmgE/PrpD family protein [Sodalis praecaptivus]|uniref:MmgE/PrpD family protein n=1 Tax=Sodalis praecaptivus TaxID=1239307 RepID=W0HS34_9GAMM|nr:MmgE/PrpD family protein [Sodalis praecaptivus]AHF76589.1 MmgE/PrpD family protein [Sodalis praecaptivus]